MAILPLVIAPDPRLKTKSEPVKEVNDDIRKLCDDLLETMYHNNGIGLAAVQVGVMKRVIVVDVEWSTAERPDDPNAQASGKDGKPITLINPEIIEEDSEPNLYKEGCLSFPEQYSDVERPKEVTVKYLDEHGAQQTLHTGGLLATCIQHEIDHVNGVTFVDHISRLKREMIMKRLNKLKKSGALDDMESPTAP